MTPEQEKELLEGHAALKAQVSSHSSKVSELEKSLAEKNAVIEMLKKGHADLTQDSELSRFKSAYPDVPEEVFHHTNPEKRQEVGAKIQAGFSKVKATVKTDPTSPVDLWTQAGGIGPTDDATIAAEQQANKKEMEAAKAAGDPLRMLKAKGSEVIEHLSRSLRNPVTR